MWASVRKADTLCACGIGSTQCWCEPKLSSGGEKHIQFRERKGRLIPYHEITLPEKFQIQKITFGPGYHQGTEKRALQLIVDAYLPGRKVDIVATKVPLRRD